MNIYSYFMFCSRNDKLNFNTWRHLRASDILSDITCKTEWYTPVPIREMTTSVESILLRVCFVIKVNRNTLYVIIPWTPRMCVRVCVCLQLVSLKSMSNTHIRQRRLVGSSLAKYSRIIRFAISASQVVLLLFVFRWVFQKCKIFEQNTFTHPRTNDLQS